MGRSFAEVCDFLSCTPSELYIKHPNITIGDFIFISTYRAKLREEENERIVAMMEGLGK